MEIKNAENEKLKTGIKLMIVQVNHNKNNTSCIIPLR